MGEPARFEFSDASIRAAKSRMQAITLSVWIAGPVLTLLFLVVGFVSRGWWFLPYSVAGATIFDAALAYTLLTARTQSPHAVEISYRRIRLVFPRGPARELVLDKPGTRIELFEIPSRRSVLLADPVAGTSSGFQIDFRPPTMLPKSAYDYLVGQIPGWGLQKAAASRRTSRNPSYRREVYQVVEG